MQSRLIINLVLLVLLVSIGSFLILSEEEESEAELIKVSDVKAETITDIKINNISGREIQFKKEQQQWRMTLPYQAPAHPTRIEALLSILDSNSIHQLNIKEMDLQRFQLQPANQSLSLNEHVFQFGDVNPLDKTRYVLYNDIIHLIHDNLYHQLSTNPSFFINPKILPNEKIISSIETPDYILRREQGNWHYDSDKEKDSETINNLIDSWKKLEANTIQEMSFTDANNKIVLNLNNGSTIEYLIMPENPSLILGRKDLGLQFHINEYNANQIFPIEAVEKEQNVESDQ